MAIAAQAAFIGYKAHVRFCSCEGQKTGSCVPTYALGLRPRTNTPGNQSGPEITHTPALVTGGLAALLRNIAKHFRCCLAGCLARAYQNKSKVTTANNRFDSRNNLSQPTRRPTAATGACMPTPTSARFGTIFPSTRIADSSAMHLSCEKKSKRHVGIEDARRDARRSPACQFARLTL